MKLKLTGKITSLVVGVVLLSLTTISLIGYFSARRVVVSDTVAAIKDASKANAAYLDMWMSDKELVNVTSGDIERYVSGNRVDKSYLQGFKDLPSVSDIFVGYADGAYTDGGDWVPPSGYDCRTRDWYKTGIQSPSIEFTRPYIDKITNKLVVSIVKQAHNNKGELIGVVGEDIDLETILSTVRDVSINGKGTAYFIDGDVIVASKNKSQIGKNVREVFGTDIAFGDIVKTNEGTTVFSKMPITGWTFGVSMTDTEMFGSVYDLRTKFIVFTIIALLIASLIAVWFSRKLSRPLIEARDVLNQISDGDFTVRLSVEQLKRADEVGDIIRALNTLLNDLSESLLSIKVASV